MTIKLICSYYGKYLIIEDGNYKATLDVEERIYEKTPEGKSDFSKAPLRDIETDALKQFDTLLSEMIYYRERPYDSSQLIELLMDKLPEGKAAELIGRLSKTYIEE